MPSKRQDRVNELLKREISTTVQRDYEFPDHLVTINDVETSPDLREAKVHIGILGSRPNEVMKKLNENRAPIQNTSAKRLTIRNTPILSFHHDTSVERGLGINNLLDEVDKLPTAPPAEEEE